MVLQCELLRLSFQSLQPCRTLAFSLESWGELPLPRNCPNKFWCQLLMLPSPPGVWLQRPPSTRSHTRGNASLCSPFEVGHLCSAILHLGLVFTLKVLFSSERFPNEPTVLYSDIFNGWDHWVSTFLSVSLASIIAFSLLASLVTCLKALCSLMSDFFLSRSVLILVLNSYSKPN